MLRQVEVVGQYWAQPVETIKQAIVDDVHHHMGTQKMFDDLTMVILKQK